MADNNMIHFKKFSIVRGHVSATLNLDRFASRFPDAQAWLGEQVLQSCRAFMPIRTGSQQQRSYVADNGRRVVFPGPYARYLYMGKVMVDPETGSPFAREGVRKVVTDRPLTFSRAGAVDHWFDAAKARDLDGWVKGVQNYIRTGRA